MSKYDNMKEAKELIEWAIELGLNLKQFKIFHRIINSLKDERRHSLENGRTTK